MCFSTAFSQPPGGTGPVCSNPGGVPYVAQVEENTSFLQTSGLPSFSPYLKCNIYIYVCMKLIYLIDIYDVKICGMTRRVFD